MTQNYDVTVLESLLFQWDAAWFPHHVVLGVCELTSPLLALSLRRAVPSLKQCRTNVLLGKLCIVLVCTAKVRLLPWSAAKSLFEGRC